MNKVQKGIYLDKEIAKKAKIKCAMKDKRFSEYIEDLIRKDLEGKTNE